MFVRLPMSRLLRHDLLTVSMPTDIRAATSDLVTSISSAKATMLMHQGEY